MKLSHFTLVILFVFIGIYYMYSLVSQKTVASSTSNKEYSSFIATACHDAIKTVDLNKTFVFEEEKDRKIALNTLYKTLLKSLRMDNGLNDEYIKEKTPFVILVDNNGFYLSYNTAFDEDMTIGEPEGISACTGLNTWSKTISGNTVRFYLIDYIEVMTSSNIKYKGTVSEVYKKMEEDGTPFTLLASSDFEEIKNDCIIKSMEDEINYLLNTQGINIGSWRMGYSVSLSENRGEDWTRMLKNPTIISFLQGKTERNMTLTLNIYGYSASEITKGQLYYSEGGLYYRATDNLYTTETVEDNGVRITTKKYKENIGTMEELAEKGNDPDITTYRNE